jgi:hypothetical protein
VNVHSNGRAILGIAGLEGEQPLGELLQGAEIVGGERLALHDREVELDLVEPGGVDRQVDQAQVLVGALQPVDRGLAGVGGAVVDDPEDPAGRGVGLGAHHFLDQAPEGLDPGLLLYPAEEVGVVDVPSGEIGKGAAAAVLELDQGWAARRRGQGPVAAAQRLQLGLLVGGDHVLVGAQAPALEAPLVEIEHRRGLGGEVGVAGKEPRAHLPGLDRRIV